MHIGIADLVRAAVEGPENELERRAVERLSGLGPITPEELAGIALDLCIQLDDGRIVPVFTEREDGSFIRNPEWCP